MSSVVAGGSRGGTSPNEAIYRERQKLGGAKLMNSSKKIRLNQTLRQPSLEKRRVSELLKQPDYVWKYVY